MAKTLTAVEKVKRDAEVVRLRLEYPTRTWEWVAVTVSAIKPEWKIAARTCQTVYSTWQQEKAEELAHPDALEIVQEHIQGFRLLREQQAQVAREAAGKLTTRIHEKTGEEQDVVLGAQPQIVLGALKAMADLRLKELTLLQETGLLPKNLGRIEMELDLRRVEEAVFVIIDRFVPKDDRTAATEVLVDALTEQLPTRQRQLEKA